MSIHLLFICFAKGVYYQCPTNGVYNVLLHRVNTGVHGQHALLYSTWITVEYKCFPMVYKLFLSQCIFKSVLRPFFVDGRHGNTLIHMCTKFQLHALHDLQV